MYFEWLIVLRDYFKTTKKNERRIEIISPIVVSLIVSIIYWWLNLSSVALIHLRSILPPTISILIGFSMTGLTIIITSDNNAIRRIKNQFTKGRKIVRREITLYQWLVIMFIYTIIVEIFLLLFIFFSAFLIQVITFEVLAVVLLFVQVLFLLHIFLVLLRNMAYIYFIFYNNTDEEDDL